LGFNLTALSTFSSKPEKFIREISFLTLMFSEYPKQGKISPSEEILILLQPEQKLLLRGEINPIF